MRVLVIGAAGMLGRKLADALIAKGSLNGEPIAGLMLADVVKPPIPQGAPAETTSLAIDLTETNAASRLLAGNPDLIYHLAAIVSGEAEADFEKGYLVNFDGTRDLFEAIRKRNQEIGYYPRVIFTSSLAVFGHPFPETIADDFFETPLSSYGTQKAMAELLLADYSRRRFFDGVGLRLPTICIRPGAPNKAASSFYSSILREPLHGLEAVLPVPPTLRHWFASPRAAIKFLLHAALIETSRLGVRRTITMPGVSATVEDQIEALRRAAGDKAVDLIHQEHNPAVLSIVEGWPQRFDAKAAIDLGFTAEASMDEIIAVHLEDDFASV